MIPAQRDDRGLNNTPGKLDKEQDAIAIRHLCETDRVEIDLIMPGLEHAWNGSHFNWGPQLVSIQQWRNKTKNCPAGKFIAMLNQMNDPGNPQPQRGGSTPPSKIEKDGYV